MGRDVDLRIRIRESFLDVLGNESVSNIRLTQGQTVWCASRSLRWGTTLSKRGTAPLKPKSGLSGPPESFLLKRIYDPDSVDLACRLHVFGEEHAASRLSSGAHDQRVPEINAMKPVEVDRC